MKLVQLEAVGSDLNVRTRIYKTTLTFWAWLTIFRKGGSGVDSVWIH